VEELKIPQPDSQDLYFPTQYSQSFINQLRTILWKQFITYWRSPDYNLVRFIFTLLIAVIIGSLYWQIGTDR
jgi:hypothetical protein